MTGACHLVAEIDVQWLAIERHRVEHLRLNAGCGELRFQGVAHRRAAVRRRHADSVLMIDVAASRQLLRRDHSAKVVCQVGGVCPTLLVALRQQAKLDEAHRGQDLRHPEVVAQRLRDVARRLAVAAEAARFLCQRSIVCRDHAAFAGGHILRRVEGEAAGPEATRHPPVEARAVRLSRVFNDEKAVLTGDGVYRFHVAGLPEQVHRQNAARVRRYLLLDARRVEVEIVATDVDEHRAGAGEEDSVRGGGEGEGRRNYFVAGAKAMHGQGGHESSCTRRYGYRFPRAAERRKALLQLADPFPLRKAFRVERRKHRCLFLVADDRFCDTDHYRSILSEGSWYTAPQAGHSHLSDSWRSSRWPHSQT